MVEGTATASESLRREWRSAADLVLLAKLGSALGLLSGANGGRGGVFHTHFSLSTPRDVRIERSCLCPLVPRRRHIHHRPLRPCPDSLLSHRSKPPDLVF